MVLAYATTCAHNDILDIIKATGPTAANGPELFKSLRLVGEIEEQKPRLICTKVRMYPRKLAMWRSLKVS